MLFTLPLFFAAALDVNATKVQAEYDTHLEQRLVPLIAEVVRFPTVAGNDSARDEQQAWVRKTAASLGLIAREAGKVTEVELPGPAGAPVLGLVVHGDVQPVDADAWSFPPFSAKVENGYIYGRGTADDKGPLVQALLAMAAMKDSGVTRTHTIRLLVGSDEESGSTDITEYLVKHDAPDYSLVLDSMFPVVVGEKAWSSLTLATPLAERGDNTMPYVVTALSAGLAPSIVPDHAELTLHWSAKTPAEWTSLEGALHAFKMPAGTRAVTRAEGDELRIVTYGKSAHGGVNLEGGRNALVALARLMEKRLPSGGANDLLAFARMAGTSLTARGLGLTQSDAIWGESSVNVATIKPDANNAKLTVLTLNIRSIPAMTGPALEHYLASLVTRFNRQTGASLVSGGYNGDKPLVFDPKAKLITRLLSDYAKATGSSTKPSISGGGTYAKRLPRSIAFGMWFPEKPYPGHDVDEKVPIADLERGERVLIATLVDLATGPAIHEAFKP
jgi:succinyl-diaminopimelate desuccinylase